MFDWVFGNNSSTDSSTDSLAVNASDNKDVAVQSTPEDAGAAIVAAAGQEPEPASVEEQPKIDESALTVNASNNEAVKSQGANQGPLSPADTRGLLNSGAKSGLGILGGVKADLKGHQKPAAGFDLALGVGYGHKPG